MDRHPAGSRARVVASIASRATLPAARVLARSLARRHPEIDCRVLLADDDRDVSPGGGAGDRRGGENELAEPFRLVRWGELAFDRPREDAWLRFRHEAHALACAATPHLLAHLLGQGSARVLFLKQESLVVGDLGPLFARLERASIVLTPHLLAPLPDASGLTRELEVLLAGAFNGGCLGVADREPARRFLAWWRDRVALDCRHAVGEGVHFEQRWLDLVPSYFDEVDVVREPGANVGHWVLPERTIEAAAEGFSADGAPLRVFRASGYDPHERSRATRFSPRLAVAAETASGALFELYRSELLAAGYEAARALPHAWSRFRSGVAIPAVARRLHRELGEAAERFADPFDDLGPDSFASYLRAPADPGDDGRPERISRLWRAIYDERADVALAFPDLLGRDQAGFLAWTRSSGRAEHAIDPELA